jgi:hypothetical protein
MRWLTLLVLVPGIIPPAAAQCDDTRLIGKQQPAAAFNFNLARAAYSGSDPDRETRPSRIRIDPRLSPAVQRASRHHDMALDHGRNRPPATTVASRIEIAGWLKSIAGKTARPACDA